MNSLIKKIYRIIFPDYLYYIKKEIQGCKSVLDLGCGYNSPLRFIKKDFYSVGVDLFKDYLSKSQENKIHDHYYNINVLDIDKQFKEKSFDAVIALDLIEHLNKEDGLKLLKLMEKIAERKVIIFTPNGFLKQGKYDNNEFQEHKSGWDSREMKKLGYNVIGINGLKNLRGGYSTVKYNPRALWTLISDITQIMTRYFPRYAFQILCIKKIN